MKNFLALFFTGIALPIFAEPWISLIPKADFIDSVHTPTLSLNGTWAFGEPSKPIQVPGEWRMQGFTVEKNKPGIYEREVRIPRDWKGFDGVLRFDAVHASSVVFWDGREIGRHEGGFVPFEFILPRMLPGSHTLRVEATSESIADTLSTVSQYASHQVGGILRKVTLHALSSPRLASARVETQLKDHDRSALVKWHIVLENPSGEEADLKVEIRKGNGETASRCTLPIPPGKVRKEVSLAVGNPLLWTSETPNLYTLEWTIVKKGRPYAGGSRKIGLREIRIDGNRLMVNGRPVKLLAVNRHEVHPLRGRSLTRELSREDARLYKSANVNCVRTSHYPPSEEFLEACDTLGLFVECEAALCWIQHGANPVWRKGWNWLDKKYLPYMVGANLDQIKAYADHPSLIIWSLGNESRWSPLWEETLAKAKEADPTRPFTFHDQCWGGFNNAGSKADIAVYHYPGENNTHMWNEKGKPVWFGEYAHLQCYNRRENQTDPGIRDDWGRPLARMVDLFWKEPGCLGGAIWSGIDDLFLLPEGKICGYGHWGVIDGWRREKPETEGVRRAYAPVRVTLNEPGKQPRITLQNRYNFLKLTQLRWETAQGKMGKVALSIAPHATGSVDLPASEGYAFQVFNSKNERAFTGKYGSFPDTPKAETFLKEKGAAITFHPDASFSANGRKFPAPRPCIIPLTGQGGAAGPAGSVLSDNIPPFTPVESLVWKASDKTHRTFSGENGLLSATLNYEPTGGNSVKVSYSYRLKKGVNPRQWGLVFTLPREAETLRWSRKIEGLQPAGDQIGRATGVAPAGPLSPVKRVKASPAVPWSQDSHPLGTPDFRSTRTNLYWISLGIGEGETLFLHPVQGTPTLPAARAWRGNGAVYLLGAGWNTGGYDGFFNVHYWSERRPVKVGGRISGELCFRLFKEFTRNKKQ